jgi:hypothetical protein
MRSTMLPSTSTSLNMGVEHMGVRNTPFCNHFRKQFHSSIKVALPLPTMSLDQEIVCDDAWLTP